MINKIKAFFASLKKDGGQALVEYALIVGLIAVAGIAALTAVGSNANSALNNIAGKLDGGGEPEPTVKVLVIADIPAQDYTGSQIKPTPAVTCDGKTLTAGTDFEYSYGANIGPGTGTVTVTGKGTYAGSSAQKSFTIGKGDLSKATIETIPTQEYVGDPVKPEPKVTLDGKTLTKGVDFTYSYSNNTGKGTGTVTITGIGKYTGTKSATFTIAVYDCLTFSSSSSFTLRSKQGTGYWDGTVYTSTDKKTWTTWTGSTISSGTGNKLYVRGKGNTKIISGSGGYDKWVLTGSNISCTGNIENLLNYETVAAGNHPTMANGCFSYLFLECTALTTAPTLPATTLTEDCYKGMFQGCTSLNSAPALPATTLKHECYAAMFQGCTSLTTVPALPATKLDTYCYAWMFAYCTSLTTVPALPATTITEWSYSCMFDGCTSLKVYKTSGTGHAIAWRLPTSGTGTAGEMDMGNMLYNTGGDNIDTPTINTTYYVENTPK